MNVSNMIKHILGALILGAFSLLVYCGFRVWVLDLAERNNTRHYQDVQGSITAMAPEQVLAMTVPRVSTEILPEYQSMVQEYPNFAGWISIYGTDLSLPVMQEQEDDQDFYLTHDYQGAETEFGCPYIPYYDSYDSDNVIIYGHNMRHEQMFGLLHRYQDQEFWEDHRLINFDTPYQHKVYEVFSVMIVSVEDRHFRFQTFTDFRSPSQAHFYINESIERSIFDTGVEPEDDSKLLTLVTCEYTIPNGNGRLVIVARDVTNYSH